MRLSWGGVPAQVADCPFCDHCRTLNRLRTESEKQTTLLAAAKVMTEGVGTSVPGEVRPEGRHSDIGMWSFDRHPVRNASL